ncbi:MAG TPA: glycosyltransferase [Gemmataceae bacterium]|jgi:glycosyltransferase involved in cell wall biosynthesis|nr:glycosyltransferase [Gemmataceae bacterium]
MPHVHYVLPNLGYAAAAKQVSLVAPALVRPGWSAEVSSLAGDGPFVHPLRTANVPVVTSRTRDVRNWVRLRHGIPKLGQGLVHAFGMTVLRRLWLATLGQRRPPVVLSLTGREVLSRWDRRCLSIVSCVLVPHQQAAGALIAQLIPAERIRVVPPAVTSRSGFQPDQLSGQVGNLTYPAGAPLIVTAGMMPDRHRLLQAVWAFEFLRYPHADAHLVVVGDGPGRARLEANALGLAPEGSRIHFVGARSDLSATLGLADVVAVLQPWGGVNVALEAMAAGRAVIAAWTPDLAAIVGDRETGLLVEPNDAVAAAKAIRKLLLDPAERRRLGDAARAHVNEHHGIEKVVGVLEAVYGEAFTSTRSELWAK